jgi:nicotinamide-nucleotide amidase
MFIIEKARQPCRQLRSEIQRAYKPVAVSIAGTVINDVFKKISMKKESAAEIPHVTNQIGELLIRRHESIAVAESVTAGLVQYTLAAVENASLFFQGGLTAYNLGQKARHLHIEPIHAIACNCVSENVAAEMAINVCELFQSDWGLSVTGYAAPVQESDNKLFAFISVAAHGKLLFVRKIISPTQAPPRVQQLYLSELMQKTLACIRKSRKK